VVFWASNRVEVINIADVWTELTVSSFTVRYAKDSTTDMEPHENRSPLEITNDVSDYINVLVRIAHIICNHTLHRHKRTIYCSVELARFSNCCSGDQIKEDGMGGACSTHEEDGRT